MAPRVSELKKNPRERLCLSPPWLPSSQSLLWKSARRSLIVAHIQQQPPQGGKGIQIRIKFCTLRSIFKPTRSSPPANPWLEMTSRGRILADFDTENTVSVKKLILDWKSWPPEVVVQDWNARDSVLGSVEQVSAYAPSWDLRRMSHGRLDDVSLWPGMIWVHAWVWARFFGPNPRSGLRSNFGTADLGSVWAWVFAFKLGFFPKIVVGVELDAGKT